MTSKALEIRVGVTVVIASTILIVGIMWFQKFKLAEKRYTFFVRFPEVGGLTEDDPVMVNGVERGRVGRVVLEKYGVLVEMGVGEKVVLPSDSRVALRSIGIMGERFVSIKTGRAEDFIQPGDTLVGIMEAGMSEVMGEAGKVLGELVETTGHLKEVLRILTEGGNLEASMENLKEFSEGLRDATEKNREAFSRAIEKLESVASMLDRLVGSRYAALDSSLEAMGNAGQRMEVIVDNLAQASSELKAVGEKLRAGEGTLGRLLNDEELINRIEATVRNLDDLISDMKKHPGRYLTIRLF